MFLKTRDEESVQLQTILLMLHARCTSKEQKESFTWTNLPDENETRAGGHRGRRESLSVEAELITRLTDDSALFICVFLKKNIYTSPEGLLLVSADLIYSLEMHVLGVPVQIRPPLESMLLFRLPQHVCRCAEEPEHFCGPL